MFFQVPRLQGVEYTPRLLAGRDGLDRMTAMKKIATVLGVVGLLLILAAGVAGWWFFLRIPGSVSPAQYLPAGTVFYAEIPDGARSWLRYQQSGFKKIAEHEETRALVGLVGAAFADAAKDLPKDRVESAKKAGEELLRAFGGVSFLAVTKLDVNFDKENPAKALEGVSALAGFHHSPGDGRHVDAFFAEVEKLVAGEAPAFTRGQGNIGDVAYQYVEFPSVKGLRLCYARWNHWDLFSFGESALNDFVKRAQGGDSPDALVEHAAFRTTRARLDEDRDGFIYLDTSRLIEVYSDVLGSAVPQVKEVVGQALEKLEFLEGVAWSVAFQGETLFERVVVLAPEAGRKKLGSVYQPVALKSLKYTSAATQLYVAQNIDLENDYDQQVQAFEALQKSIPSETPPVNPFEMIEGQLKAMGLDLRENLLRALGPELAFVIDWPEGQALPELLVLLAVKDAEKFKPLNAKIQETLTMMAVGFGHSEPLKAGAFEGLTVHPAQVPMISPTVASSPEFLLLSLSGAGAQRLVGGAQAPLTMDRVTGVAKPPATTLNAAFIDLSGLVGRGYESGRPFFQSYASGQGNPTLKDAAAQLPERLGLAPLLGTWRSLSFTEGDLLVAETRSPAGNLIIPLALFSGLAIPAVASAQEKALVTREVASARQLGVALLSAANDGGGVYPATLEALADRLDEATFQRLTLDPKTGSPLWIYHPGLTTQSPTDAVLLESAGVVYQGGKPGKVKVTVGLEARWVSAEEGKPTQGGAVQPPDALAAEEKAAQP
jgi:hypothetical protein